MLPVVVVLLMVLLVGLYVWRRPARIRARTCCTLQSWPPDDLTGRPPAPRR